MKLKFTAILFLICSMANARFEKATILFKDGHTENGYLKSFLEEKIIDLNVFSSVEHGLNLDDKNVKFKTTEDGEVRTIPSEEIDEVTLTYEDGSFTTFKSILLKDVKSNGEINEGGTMVFLPYVKKGAINIYGIKYTENSNSPLGSKYGSIQSEVIRFYYQNKNENYAINNNKVDPTIMFNLKNRMINPFKDLLKDCPTIMDKLNAASGEKLGWFKMDKEAKEKLKEFKKLDKSEREKLAVYHNHYGIEKMFTEYEQCK